MARARGYVGDRVAACSHHGLLLRVGGARASRRWRAAAARLMKGFRRGRRYALRRREVVSAARASGPQNAAAQGAGDEAESPPAFGGDGAAAFALRVNVRSLVRSYPGQHREVGIYFAAFGAVLSRSFTILAVAAKNVMTSVRDYFLIESTFNTFNPRRRARARACAARVVGSPLRRAGSVDAPRGTAS